MPLPPGVHLTGLTASPTTDIIAMATSDWFQIATANSNPPTTTLMTSILATATSAAVAATSSSPSSPDDESTGECQLLGPFAILIQGALGALALLSLVYKRWRERPQRPLKIWAFDVSKQVVGSILLHLANLVMSMFSAGQITRAVAIAALDAVKATEYQPNPCSFYLLNLAIDTTLGIPILIVLLRLFSAAFSLTPLANPPESIQSGNYGDPPRYTWWMKQSLIYFLGLLGMKVCVFILFALMPWLGRVGDWALRWTEGNEALQIAFVMLIFPLIMNALQYYIIDTFIKKRETGAGSRKDAAGVDDESEIHNSDDDSGSNGSDETGGLLAGRDEHGDLIDTHGERDDTTRRSSKSKAKTTEKEKEKEAGIKTKWRTVPDEEEGEGRSGTPSSSEPSPKGQQRQPHEDDDLLSKVPKPTE